MSLLDDVSIVVTPNGYKAGELYAVIPVPSEGAEELNNTDFATETVWSFSGTTFSVGAVLFDNANDNVFQNFPNTINTRYKLTITKTGSGVLRLRTGYAGTDATKIDIPESGILYFTSTSDTNRIQIYGDLGSVSATLNTASVKEYTAADMDVTRATAATRVDENGLVNYAEVLGGEEVTNGSFTTDSDWDKTGTWSIENNYAIANGNSTSQYIQQDFTITNAKIYLFTYEIIENTLNGNGASLSGSGGFVSVSLSSAIGTHQVYITADDSGAAYALKIGVSGTATTGTIKLDNISVKEVTRDNVPRIDYTGGGCPHILAEPQRTNLIPYSEDFSDSSWIDSGVSITDNNATSPDGTLNASTINFSASSQYLLRNQNITFAIGDSISISIYANTSTVGFLSFGGATPSGTDVANVETLSGGFYRHTLTRTFTASGTSVQFIIWDAAIGNYVIWGGQIEAGSYATSYIPNFGTALGVTRNQDIFTRDGIGSLINSTEGVLFLEIAALSDDGTNRYLSINDGTTSNYIYFRFVSTSNTVLMRTVVAGVTINTLQTAITDTTDFNKFAFKWKSGDYAFWINGVESLVDASATIFGADVLNTIEFSFPTSGGGGFPSKVKQLQVYTTALTDDQIRQITQ